MNERLAPAVDVAVVGAGAIGASVALWLERSGADVAVVEAGSGWAAGCSWGNAGWICPSHAGPFAKRREVVEAARWLLRRDSPLGLRPTPSVLPWLAKLLAAGDDRTVARVTGNLRERARRSLALHGELIGQGIETGFRQDGLLDVHLSEQSLSRAVGEVARHRAGGVSAEVLARADIAAHEPGLDGRISGAVYFPDEAHCRPELYVRAVGRAALELGATLHDRASVHALEQHGSRSRLITSRGYLDASVIVIAAGTATAKLTRTLGEHLPLVSGKGYSADLDAEGIAVPKRPIMITEARVAVTPFDDCVRLAGTMELGAVSSAVNRRRLDAIIAAGRDTLPALRQARMLTSWAGHRPCTPDGLPIVGWARSARDVVLASGHAMLGITLAPVTADEVTQLIGAAS